MSALSKRPARAIADLAEGRILAEVEIAAPPERVFRALTDPSEVPNWWGSEQAYRTTSWAADLRPGGAWRAEGKGSDGHTFSVGGEYVEVCAPSRLVYTWRADWDGAHETRVTCVLVPTAVGTKVTLRHEGFVGRTESCARHSEGWAMVFDWLSAHVAPAAERKYFFCRLIAPRPTFPFDMTDDERAMMGAHSAYWSAELAAGNVVVFGPVLDPKGPWGLGVIRAVDEAAARAFESKDPAIASGRGFSYEMVPMMTAVHG